MAGLQIIQAEISRKRKILDDIKTKGGQKYIKSKYLDEYDVIANNTNTTNNIDIDNNNIDNNSNTIDNSNNNNNNIVNIDSLIFSPVLNIDTNNSKISNPPNKECTQDPSSDHTTPARDNSNTSNESVLLPSHTEVCKRLRERNEPIKLFGESELETMNRLRKLEMNSTEYCSGLQNDFLKAIEKFDKDYIDALVKQHQDRGNNLISEVVVSQISLKLNYDDIISLVSELSHLKDRAKEQQIILKTFKFFVSSWGGDLNQRDNSLKISFEGKRKSAIYNQTLSYMKPLFRLLKQHAVPQDILTPLRRICIFIIERDYIKANDAYLDMAIGNAAWPLGVTMVGIHARTGREKIYATNVAHVLNDETQRKFIQGIKRILSYCQYKYPNDPSKCVEYTTNKF